MAKFFRINDRIQAAQLRVIDADGTQLGVISLLDAIEKAKQQELDLVEVAPNVNPPVARIVDFEKFRYKENKKEQAAKKNRSEVELKEIWLSPRIADHDLQTRLRRVAEFLDDGNKVKLTIKFRGREMGHPELGHQVAKKALEILGEEVEVERETKFEGRNLTTILGKKKSVGGEKEEETNAKD